jgi:rhamnulokinase
MDISMDDKKRYIAVDLGAESGRVMLAEVSSEKLNLQQIHRFENGPIEEGATLRWDFEKLFSDIKTGIAKAIKEADGDIEGIGVDSWGVDYGLLDENNKLIEKPYHYRDSRTEGMIEKASQIMGQRRLYENTGIQFMPFNTLYQLMAVRQNTPEMLTKAKKLIFMADLVSFYLCGRPYVEYTLASTSQLMDMGTKSWSKAVFETFDLPMDIMPEVVQPGTIVGKLTDELCEEFGCEPINIIATASHDTASAVAAVPADADKFPNWAYLSSGTWSLMGIETPDAIINDKTFEVPFTNEGGVCNTIRLLKNIMGLWIVQECKRQWQREGVELDYGQITNIAKEAAPFVARIDPDNGDFFSHGDMPARINKYLADTGQETIEDKGQLVRVVLESLALKYCKVLKTLEEISGASFDVLHVVGGGIQNELLCQFTANATGKRVVTGPIEATAIGNVLIQAIGAGQISSMGQARKIVRNSIEMKEYQPEDADSWGEQFNKK